MLANAITDAKTNFFMQCSWELQKSVVKLMHTLRNLQPYWSAVECRGNG
jgi:hypothetical protein